MQSTAEADWIEDIHIITITDYAIAMLMGIEGKGLGSNLGKEHPSLPAHIQ